MIIPIPAETTFEQLAAMIPSEGRDIHAGYAVLDYLEPNWMSRIQLSVLDLGNCSLCLLGQLFGGYIQALHDNGLLSLLNDDQIAYLGFDLHSEEWEVEVDEHFTYNQLTVLHEDALAERMGLTLNRLTCDTERITFIL